MPTTVICPKCQRSLPADAPQGLCPVCLFESMLASDPEPAVEADLNESHAIPASPAASRACGDYDLLQVIARGGMGIVYRARHRRLNRTVALKMISASHLAGEAAARRFRTEAEAAASLEHPNIVPIYEVGESDGRLYYTMKLFEGGSLADRMKTAPGPREKVTHVSAPEGPSLNASYSIVQFVKVVRAVHYAHQHGILHRDLKPGNILLDTEGESYVGDFGLAKRLESDLPGLTLSGAMLGTPNYMAPEQASGGSKQLTTAADIYSLGAILYELLTGQPPFRAQTTLETLRRVVDEEPKRPSSFSLRIDRDLETICLKCLEKEPSRRYVTGEDLAEDLERWLRHEPILARPTMLWEKCLKWTRRHPAWTAFLALAAVAPAVIIGILLITGANVRRERNHALVQEQRARSSELATRQNLYAADIAQAHAALAAHDYDQAWRSLVANQPATALETNDLRGFEWRWLWARAQGESLATAGGHTLGVFSLAYSPDGRTLATGEGGSIVKLWEADTLRLLRTLVEPGLSNAPAEISGPFDVTNRFPIYSVAFSGDGRLLVTASAQAWDVVDAKSGQRLERLPGGYNVTFLPGPGARLLGVAGAPPREFVMYDAAGPRLLTNWPCSSFDFALSADGRLLASFERPFLVVSELSTGKQIANFKPSGYVMDLAFSPDGRILGLCMMNEGAVDLWNLEPWGLWSRIGHHTGRIACLAFSPDGRQLATGGYDQTVRLWDLNTQRELRQFYGHRASIHAIAFSPDGRRLATGSFDGTVRLWEVSPPESLPSITNVFGAFTFSPDGRQVLTQDQDGRLTLWDLATRLPIRMWPSTPFDDALFENGRVRLIWRGSSNAPPQITLLACDSAVKATNGLLRLDGVSSPATTAGLAPDGRTCVTGHSDGTVAFWDPASGKLRHSARPHTNEVFRFAFSPRGDYLVSATWNSTWVTTWDVPSGRQLSDRHFTLRFAAALAVGPDDTSYAMGGAPLGTDIRFFALTNAAHLGTLSGHFDDVRRLAYSPDGRTLASTSLDRTLRLWHPVTGRSLVTLPQGEQLEHLAFSPDGTWLGVATARGELRLWHAPAFADLSMASRQP